MSELEKLSIILTILLAILFPVGSSIYVLGQHKQALVTLNEQVKAIPSTEELNLLLQLRDTRLQRLETQLTESLRKLDEIQRSIRRNRCPPNVKP